VELPIITAGVCAIGNATYIGTGTVSVGRTLHEYTGGPGVGNARICRDAVCPVWDERLPVRLVAGRPVLPSGHRERLLLPVPAAVLADAGAEASLFRDLLGGGVPEQAGSLRRTADHRTG
jgi:hypothetical protein